MNLLLSIVVVAAVAAITWIVANARFTQIAIPAEDDGALPEQQTFTRNFALVGGLVGIAAGVGFLIARGLWPDSAQTVFLVLGLILIAFFSIGAAVVRTQVVKGGAVESIALNVVWGVGYGIVLPFALMLA